MSEWEVKFNRETGKIRKAKKENKNIMIWIINVWFNKFLFIKPYILRDQRLKQPLQYF